MIRQHCRKTWAWVLVGLGPRLGMASNFRAPAIFLVFALHAYLLTSPGGKSPEQDLYSLRDYRISASLTQISLVHASYHHGTNGGRSAILKKSTAELDSGLLGLLILCGDISSNPGPKCKHPCGICSKTVRSNQRAVQCDSCNAWYHVKCMQMNTHVYEALANSSCIWECVVCGLPNFSSSLFESSTIEATNYFWPLDTDLSDKSHIESIYTVNQSTESTQAMSTPPGSPLHTSSPSQRKPTCSSKLRILTVNCNSLQSKAKQNQLIDLIESHNPDIICGQESKLDESMKTNEIFPPPFQDQVF